MLNIGSLVPERSVEDILTGRIRLVLGGKPYELPVRSIRANREWQETLQSDLQGLLTAVASAGDDAAGILDHLLAADVQLLDLLVSYDADGVLPPRDELEGIVRPNELLLAVIGVWRAASPLADIGLVMMNAPASSPSPAEPTSSPPTNGAGPRRTSKRRSRTSSSSST